MSAVYPSLSEIERLPEASVVSFSKGDLLYSHHDKITHLYLLLEGKLNFHHHLDFPRKDILVDKVSLKHMPIGWSAFNPPGRTISRISVSSKSAKLCKIPLEVVQSYLKYDLENKFLRDCCQLLYLQFRESTIRKVKAFQSIFHESSERFESYSISPSASLNEIATLMRKSPFLESLDEKHLKKFAKWAERKDFVSGEMIYEQDQFTQGLYVLIQGEVAIRRLEGNDSLSFRSISTPGFILGWSSLLSTQDVCQAVCAHETSVYFIPAAKILDLLAQDHDLGMAFYKKMFWLIGNHLHVLHARQITAKSKPDQVTHNLIEANRSKLKLSSAFHKVPHLMSDRNTMELGYQILHQLNESGDSQERYLASLSLDLLRTGKKEMRFFNGLKRIFEVVAESDPGSSASDLRFKCSEAVEDLFKILDFKIEGWDNLPDHAGHIFIYNHLLNDPYYTLPNNFQITLDSHFISSLILNKKYGDPGIRIVRIGKGAEYGHESYYSRLGYINVFTQDSKLPPEDQKEQSKQLFYTESSKVLSSGKNLIISPEGVSFATEDSPGDFKAGAFNLALQQEIEPYIVPIALAYFDRRIEQNLYYARIMKPFKVSEQIKNSEYSELKSFVKKYKEEFARSVREAAQRANDLRSSR